MPRQTRYSNRDAEGEEPRGRRSPSSQGLPMGPLVILVVLLAGALFFARMIAQSNEEAAEQPEVIDNRRVPFADLPREGEPVKPGSTTPVESAPKKTYPPAPRGVVDTNSTWLAALKGATEAEALFQAAQAAKEAGDHTGFRENGVAAKKRYTEIIDDTRQLEEELLEQYGDGNAEINALIKKRNEWADRRQILSKTTGR